MFDLDAPYVATTCLSKRKPFTDRMKDARWREGGSWKTMVDFKTKRGSSAYIVDTIFEFFDLNRTRISKFWKKIIQFFKFERNIYNLLLDFIL